MRADCHGPWLVGWRIGLNVAPRFGRLIFDGGNLLWRVGCRVGVAVRSGIAGMSCAGRDAGSVDHQALVSKTSSLSCERGRMRANGAGLPRRSGHCRSAAVRGGKGFCAQEAQLSSLHGLTCAHFPQA